MKKQMCFVDCDGSSVYIRWDLIMQRELSKWVLRNLPDYSIIDSDKYRNLLAERNQLDLYSKEVQMY